MAMRLVFKMAVAMRYAGQDIISLISVTCHIVLYSCKHNVQRHAYIHVQLFVVKNLTAYVYVQPLVYRWLSQVMLRFKM